MISISRRCGTLIAAFCVMANVSLGTSYAPKADNRIICVDLQTGELVWEHIPKEMSDAHFEWYMEGVVAYPHYSGDDRRDPMFLSATNGKPVQPFARDPNRVYAKSSVFWPEPAIKLANGWRLSGFSPGNHQTLVFRDADDKEKWSIATGGYPHVVRAWKNFVFYAFSYLSNEGILYAYSAGEKRPNWTLDLNTIVKDRPQPLTRMIFQIIEDRIYLQANEHIFCIHPQTGELYWHRDLAKELDLKFEPDFFGGALNLAVFAKSGDVLVVSFERRVVALKLDTAKYLWHLQPDTFPHCPFPVVHENRVVLTAGVKRILTRLSNGNVK